MDFDAIFQSHCRTGQHPFNTMLQVKRSISEDTVVRWCPICGTITIDIDFDGRTKPGAVHVATRPKVLEDR